MIRYIHADLVGMVYGSARDAGDILKLPDVLEKAYQLGRELALR
jgi:hypothetical protein